MNMRFLICMVTLIVGVCNVHSQTTITGKIINKQGDPLFGTVMIQEKDKVSISGYTYSDDDGNYSIKYEGTADSLTVIVTGISIGKHSKIISNKSAKVDFTIEEKSIDLKEVTIRAEKIEQRGDTINYLVSSFSDQSDRVIGDVLKKMPGIEVKDNGSILYNGKNISKFYVENMDLLKGRYNIATNNITAKDVATVQVLENHQPVKALKDIAISDQAALNLKLKESAKGTLALTGMAGLGYEPMLWNAELLTMYFGKKAQNLAVYKGNNSGDNVKSEFRAHYDYDRALWSVNRVLDIQMPSTPPIAEKRYLDNSTHAVTVNQMIKLREEEDLSINALFFNDHIKKQGYSLYEQYLPGDSILSISETIKSTTKANNAEIALRYNRNEDNYFLNNALNLKGNWNDSRASGLTQSNVGLNETITQDFDRPEFLVDNTMELIKKVGNQSYKSYFSVGYGQASELLSIHPTGYLGMNEYESLDQEAFSKNLASSLRVSYGFRSGNFDINYDLWGRADLQNTETELTGKNTSGLRINIADSLKNNLWYNTFQNGITQTYTYKKNKFKSTLTIPVSYFNLAVKDQISDNSSMNDDKVIINPSVFTLYDISQMFTVSANAGLSQSYGDKDLYYSGYILRNYRNLERKTTDHLLKKKSKSAKLSVNYRNLFAALFVNGSIGYNNSWSNLLYGYSYSGIMRMMTTQVQPIKSDSYTFDINANKGLDFWSSNIRISVGYSTGNRSQLIQDAIFEYKTDGYYLAPSLHVSPVSFFSTNYSVSWSRSKNQIKNQSDNLSSIDNISQTGKLNVFLSKSITINFNVEHCYNSIASKKKTNFADAAILFKNTKLDLELNMNNVFNSKQYISASHDNISSYYYSYNLRPFSILAKIRFKIK